jgi:putative endonuclease
MLGDHNTIGDIGERLAAEFLQSKGLVLVDSNFSRKWGELDLITHNNQKDGRSTLVFFEVKTVRCRVPEEVPAEGDNAHRPEEKVNDEKQERMRRIIQTYLDENATGRPHWRIDLVCVYLDLSKEAVNINWLKNIII